MGKEKVTEKTQAVEVIEQAKLQTKLWFIAFLLTLIALAGTNAYWIYTFQSYEYISQDGEGINSVNSGNQGDLVNGPNSEN